MPPCVPCVWETTRALVLDCDTNKSQLMACLPYHETAIKPHLWEDILVNTAYFKSSIQISTNTPQENVLYQYTWATLSIGSTDSLYTQLTKLYLC